MSNSKKIHRLVPLTCTSNSLPSVLSVARLNHKGNLTKANHMKTDMIFGDDEYIIEKGLGQAPIIGYEKSQDSTQKNSALYGGLSVYDGHPDGEDLLHKSKWVVQEANITEELKVPQYKREKRTVGIKVKNPEKKKGDSNPQFVEKSFEALAYACYSIDLNEIPDGFAVHWDQKEDPKDKDKTEPMFTTKGVCHGVIYPTRPLPALDKIPHYGPNGIEYYEFSLEAIKRLNWKRCDNVLILKARSLIGLVVVKCSYANYLILGMHLKDTLF